jgi:hypothetical protein
MKAQGGYVVTSVTDGTILIVIDDVHVPDIFRLCVE